ncbi:putative glutaryl 7-ACA acylase [Streptomyces ambofaciens ATCC 23877]|uniref:Putative glutaryl 7-ACA acylase n=1 Tax=Streptomyces ambofaciens (strain ATCC 23877 / 3486 / DSM 40053 / JCM 4204 / NBRC 12836 / NRRL B-2516) TaxID=278992 RepID=A3KIM8_STRA7|nr:CocE/NonD family hydrolase [Streptomyces ambofaciens]AKZ53700.1 putative glutaryl 7-ACA acylase [Streptomyces ambofaciens ATCC 23877]CAJ89562.1 putative glutaryl 7-ACA acylase [Streptomyces ambofaciens ATCC 23877]
MRHVTNLPFTTKEEEHVVIPMSDGVRLSARIWRPTSSDQEPVPAVLEYIPYRKRDLTAVRDSVHHPYIAGHGYACVRVDLRGTGESEGVLRDEYLELEQSDAEEVLAWIAEQPWCDGTTGMMGLSWGAFAALQVAARRPPSLKAIVIASFTDDRHADDMHYMGGAMLSDNLAEAGTMFAYATCPPDPAVVGDRWRDMWHERLENSQPWVLEWLRHQRRDDYWRHASVAENYQDVRCPVLASSGWADGYSNAVTRLLAHLDVPRKGLIGPWSHKFPHLGEPGPAIGYLQEVVRWWDHWLKGVDNGVMDGPMLQTWMQDSVPPSTSYEERPGRWVAEPCWPSPHVHPVTHPLSRHRIGAPDEAGDRSAASAQGDASTVRSPLSVGQFAGKWASYNAPPDLPYDQREEDGGSLVFETEPLTERVEILGSPTVDLDLSADAPVAMVAARLSDVSPDGAATRVTYGLLNLTRRDSAEEPEPLEPGRRYRATVHLNGVAQSFPPGHRIRLSLSTSYWPLAWPPPKPAMLSVYDHSSTLTLPVRPPERADDTQATPFGDPEGTSPVATTTLTPPEERWDVKRDLVGYNAELETVKDRGTVRFEEIGLDVGRRAYERYASVADDFTSVSGESTWTMSFRRDEWDVRVVTHTRLTCDESSFFVDATLDGYDGGRRVFSHTWNETVPRDLL